MADITFHSMADSAYLWTAMHIADEKGVSHELAHLNYRSPEHLALHPFGKMPVLQHGDFYLYESLAIAAYIDQAFDGPELTPTSPRAAAETYRWISIVNAYVFPVMNRFTKERLVRPRWGGTGDKDFMTSALEELSKQVHLIDRATSYGGFLAGDSLTLADSFLLPHVLFFALSPEGEALLRQARSATDWLERMKARPSFKNSMMSLAYETFRELPPLDAAPL